MQGSFTSTSPQPAGSAAMSTGLGPIGGGSLSMYGLNDPLDGGASAVSPSADRLRIMRVASAPAIRGASSRTSSPPKNRRQEDSTLFESADASLRRSEIAAAAAASRTSLTNFDSTASLGQSTDRLAVAMAPTHVKRQLHSTSRYKQQIEELNQWEAERRRAIA